MASLTEAFLIMDLLKNVKNDKWYNKVYLCVEKRGDKKMINGFICYICNSFEDANSYSKKMNFDKEDKRTAIVPMCKWVPIYFHKYILNKTLQKIYWNNSISIFTPINRRF